MYWVQVLSGKLDSEEEEQVWLAACNASFAAMIKDKQSREAEEAKATASLSPPFLDPPSWGPKLTLMASITRAKPAGGCRAWGIPEACHVVVNRHGRKLALKPATATCNV